jgi:ribulose-5-phosphate 4-epimerase/fuculose-1-phosphate aldolase
MTHTHMVLSALAGAWSPAEDGSLRPAQALPIPEPMTHPNALVERQHRKRTLVLALRWFAELGHQDGVAGHISVRDPIDTTHFWINPYGRAFEALRTTDLLRIDEEGQLIEGRGVLNPAGIAIHGAIHRGRADAVAVAHAHSTYGRAWSTTGRLIDPLCQEACAFYEDQALFSDDEVFVIARSTADALAVTLGPRKAAFLRNHGHLTVGATVDSAAFWFVSLERCCEIQIAAESVGKPLTVGHTQAVRTRNHVGTERAGWLGFQPARERLERFVAKEL